MEAREYDIMGARFRSAMNLAEKIETGKATEKDIQRFQILMPMVNKFCDKRHANKSEINAKVSIGFSLKDLFDKTNADKQ